MSRNCISIRFNLIEIHKLNQEKKFIVFYCVHSELMCMIVAPRIYILKQIQWEVQ